jgi:cysteine desulfurase
MSVYLDHAATTPMVPVALEAMVAYLGEQGANPSSPHQAGRAARRAVDDARDQFAVLLGCEPGEIVFTSGGTEADNLAITGAGLPGRVVTSAIEHAAVLGPADALVARLAPVTPEGLIDLDGFAKLLDPDVALISVMAANNEVGTIQPIAAIARLAKRLAPEALLHCDAVQSTPWCDLEDDLAAFDLISVSAHKFGGPKAVGALVVRPRARARLHPLLVGGAQEGGLRSGTENVAGIVGAGAAARWWRRERAEMTERIRHLRDELEDGLVEFGARPNSARDARIATIAPMHFDGVVTEELLMALDRDGVAASAGAACESGALEPSHVLLAMGQRRDEIEGSIRLSLGWSTSKEDVKVALDVIPRAVRQLRSS